MFRPCLQTRWKHVRTCLLFLTALLSQLPLLLLNGTTPVYVHMTQLSQQRKHGYGHIHQTYWSVPNVVSFGAYENRVISWVVVSSSGAIFLCILVFFHLFVDDAFVPFLSSGDPLRYHSHFVASVLESPTSSLRPMEIVAHGRLGTATKKAHLLCGWDDEKKEVSYLSIEWAGFG